MCTNCQAPYSPHWASVWQTELTPGCVNPGFKLDGLVLAVVDSLFPCYFFDFELNSRPSKCQMKSSEDLIDQLAALIDNGQETNNGQRISNSINLKDTGVWLEPFQALPTLDLEFPQMCVGEGGGPRPSKQSWIYPPWSKSIISEQCNSTLITACHKISYSMTPAQAKLCIHRRLHTHSPVRLPLAQPALLIPLWTDGGIHPWCKSEGKGDRRMLGRKGVMFTRWAHTDKGF